MFLFVNPGELHAIDICSHVTESAVLFHPRILSFEYYDLVQTGLLQPLLKGKSSFHECWTFPTRLFTG